MKYVSAMTAIDRLAAALTTNNTVTVSRADLAEVLAAYERAQMGARNEMLRREQCERECERLANELARLT